MGTLLISSSPYLVSLVLFFSVFFYFFRGFQHCLAMRLRVILACLALAMTQNMHAKEEKVCPYLPPLPAPQPVPANRKSIAKLFQLKEDITALRDHNVAIEKKILALQAKIDEQECNRTLTQSCQGTAISLEAFNKFYEEKRKSREYTEPCGALWGQNIPKKCDQKEHTRQVCGLRMWGQRGDLCQGKTNQNYGCHRHSCWRSAIEKTEKWCYIAYWNSHTQTFDTNQSVYCTSAATCGNELTTRPCATRNTSG